MPRRSARPRPDRTVDLTAHSRVCPACAGPLWSAATARRTVVTLDGSVPDQMVTDMLGDSYDLVVASLPKARRP